MIDGIYGVITHQICHPEVGFCFRGHLEFFAFKRAFPGLLRFARNDVLASLFLIDLDDTMVMRQLAMTGLVVTLWAI